jgi:hypothetical protein
MDDPLYTRPQERVLEVLRRLRRATVSELVTALKPSMTVRDVTEALAQLRLWRSAVQRVEVYEATDGAVERVGIWAAHSALCGAVDALTPVWAHLSTDEARELQAVVERLERLRDALCSRASAPEVPHG